MEKIFDYKGVIDEQIELLQGKQRQLSKSCCSIEEMCEVAKTIDYLLTARYKYEKIIK